MITKTHHFFLLSLSPWAFYSSIFSFNFIFSLFCFFKFGESFSFFFNLFFLCFSSSIWWWSYVKEFSFLGFNSFKLDMGLKFSMILFIFSEIFFFFSFFWSYFHFYFSPNLEIGNFGPSNFLLMFNCFSVPIVNTFVLLSSGVCVTLSHHFFFKKSFYFSFNFLFLTCLLGFIFTFFQLLEYNSSFFSISDSIFGSSFFILTGFHGMHVIFGTIFLSVVLFKTLKSFYVSKSLISFEMASWYWHFVDVIWIFLYFFLYFLN